MAERAVGGELTRITVGADAATANTLVTKGTAITHDRSWSTNTRGPYFEEPAETILETREESLTISVDVPRGWDPGQKFLNTAYENKTPIYIQYETLQGIKCTVDTKLALVTGAPITTEASGTQSIEFTVSGIFDSDDAATSFTPPPAGP